MRLVVCAKRYLPLVLSLALGAGCRSGAQRSSTASTGAPVASGVLAASPVATANGPPPTNVAVAATGAPFASTAPPGAPGAAVQPASAASPLPPPNGPAAPAPLAGPPVMTSAAPGPLPVNSAKLQAPVRLESWEAPDATLSVEPLVDQVLARNPSIEAMVDGWQAAAQRYPQAVSLDDPVFMSMVAPASFNSGTTEPAFIVGGSQKVPWFGKRAARGRVAKAEASAAFQDVQTARLEVAEAARIAFYDYYLSWRLLELNQQNRMQMERFRDTARRRFEANLVTQQDVLQADVALSDVARRELELRRMVRVAAARINTLLLREPDAPLPPPPAALPETSELPPAEELRALAVNCRPDLAALGARIRAEEASAALAAKEFYPDVEFYGRYDSFWQPSSTQGPLRAQTGVNMNVPIYRRKRYAAVNESLFRAGQKRAEYQQRLNDIHYEVQSAYEMSEQARQTVELYRGRFLPTAENNVSAARSSYDVGQTQFLSLIQAQQQLIGLREKQAEAQADSLRRRAELERVVGCPIPDRLPTAPEPIPAPAATAPPPNAPPAK